MDNGNNPLPDGWVWTTLGEVASVQSGVGFPEAMQGRKHGEYPLAKVSDISNAVKSGSTTLVTAANHVTSDEVRLLRARVFPVGSVLFAKIGEAVRLNRRIMAGVPLLVDNNVAGLLPRQEVLVARYVFYYMQTIDLYEHSQATTVPSVRKSDVERISFPLPPLAEQHRIVAAIEEQLTRLDAGVAALKRAQAKLRRYKAAVLKAACEGRLVPQDPNDEPAGVLLQRILAERRATWEADELAKLRAKGKEPLGDAWKLKYEEAKAPATSGLPELPEGWVWTTIQQVAPLLAGYAFASTGFRDNGVRLLKGVNVRDGWLAEDDIDCWDRDDLSRFEKYRLSAGDVVIAMDRPVYSSGSRATKVVRLTHDWDGALLLQRVGKLQTASVVNNGYLYAYLSGEAFREHLVTSQNGSQDGKDLPHVSAGVIDSAVFPLPPLAEQQRIVAEVERRLSVVEEMETAIAANLARAERLRQSILKRAFAGKLVPQDPNDEPASALLARITRPSPPAPRPQGERGGRRRRGNGRAEARQGELEI